MTSLRRAQPAATVILSRDSPDGLTVLLTRRNSNTAFGGMWVFPGGKVDPSDSNDGASHDLRRASVNAAVREAKEEVDVDLDPAALVAFSHWTPPPQAPRQFLTWFFVAPHPGGPAGAVTIDAAEVTDHTWLTPAAALAQQAAGQIELAPPTFLTLFNLQTYDSTDHLLRTARASDPPHYLTLIRKADGNRYVIWEGDVAYPDGDLAVAGPRHRIEIADATWTPMVDYR